MKEFNDILFYGISPRFRWHSHSFLVLQKFSVLNKLVKDQVPEIGFSGTRNRRQPKNVFLKLKCCCIVFLVPYYTLVTNYNCNLEYFLVASNSKNQWWKDHFLFVGSNLETNDDKQKMIIIMYISYVRKLIANF